MAHKEKLNSGWFYCPQDVARAEAPGFDDSGWERVSIPHTNKFLPSRYFDDAEYQFISWYRKKVTIPPADDEKVFLDFDGVMLACEVFANGRRLAEHKGGYTPFSVDLTGFVEPGQEAVVAVRVDSRERPDIPPFGHMVDYLTFGGIYRDVYLRVCNRSYIKDVFARATDVLTAPTLHAEVEVEEPLESLVVALTLRELSGAAVADRTVRVTGGKLRLELRHLPKVNLWSVNEPCLYLVEVELRESTGAVLDSCNFRFGFREARFCDDGVFRLNGEPLKLRGLDRHQTFPYIGQAAPARLQRRDADILKHELALNIARTSHYPQSPHFLDRCDEIGLLVFEEIPGWQHIGDEAWKELSKQDVRDMIGRDRNHPCIVLWGVRINESADDHEFYVETNKIAHELDPTRQTGGVRCHRDSEFLEDVFTYNDFSDTVLDPNHIPYLITEFSGHMYPAKTWDCEERKIEHALRHARIQSMQMLDRRIAGAIGWCAFDYNTHAPFGSGDRVCYHGVCDIFRLPKWAAHLYASQADPGRKVVLEVAAHGAVGDRNAGGAEPFVVFSNCETIRIYAGDELRGEFYPAFRECPGLEHPPFLVRGLGPIWRKAWRCVKVEGYIAGKKAAEIVKTYDPLPASLRLWADSNELEADGRDMTALNFQIVDECGGVLPYASEVVTITTQGPVEIIGDNPFVPQGGQGAVYVKAKEKAGRAVIRAKTQRLGEYTVEIKVNTRG